MPRNAKSQWDFGELFAPAAGREVPPSVEPAPGSAASPAPATLRAKPPPKIFSVTELTLGIRRALESSFGTVLVSGEVSNLRLQPSGHAYLTLKDANAQLSCVLFRGQSGAGRSGLRDGARVTLGGELTVYEPRGQYQLRVTSVELEGIGALQAAFERLKAKLNAEGLFDPARKRPIPPFPRRVGLVTSPAGAAIRDVLHVVGRRFAGLEFILVPVRVQGEGSAGEIAAAVALLNQFAAAGNALDAILVTRGGGSVEDLWAFNEEAVARAFAASAVPVISAVGHEIDFTIADFVADLRAATPSAAAEILTEGYVESVGRVEESARRLRWLARRQLDEARDTVEGWHRRLLRAHPRRQLDARAQRLDEALGRLARAVSARLARARLAQLSAARRLLASRPSALLLERGRTLDELRRRLPAAAAIGFANRQARLAQAEAALRLLAPEKVLERGYSITFDAVTGRVVRHATEVTRGSRLRTRLAQGEVESVVVPPAAKG